MSTLIRGLFITLPLLAACGEEAAVERSTSIVQRLGLAREMEPGVSVGFDLDAQVSDSLDARSCNKEDFVDPAGVRGIDNQIARLMPLVDLAGQGAVDALVQAAIGEGRLLMFVSVERTPDAETVDVLFERGEGLPLVGGDGLLLEGQTIARHTVPDLGHTQATEQADGTLSMGPFALQLPIVVFNFFFEFSIPDAKVRLTPRPEGGYDAVLGGSATVDQILGIVKTADSGGTKLQGLLGDGIRDVADLERDRSTGLCTAMSLAATFRTVPAFQF